MRWSGILTAWLGTTLVGSATILLAHTFARTAVQPTLEQIFVTALVLALPSRRYAAAGAIATAGYDFNQVISKDRPLPIQELRRIAIMKHARCRITSHSTVLMLISIPILLLTIFAVPAVATISEAEVVAVTLCFPFTPKQAAGETTTLYITNEPGDAATINISFVKPDGSQAATPQVHSLAGGETRAIDFAQLADLPAGVHQVIVGASRSVVGAAYLRNGSWNSIGVYQGVMCGPEADAAFGVFYAGSANNVTSVLHLMNGGTADAQLTLYVFDTSGNVVYSSAAFTVPAAGSIRFASADLPAGISLPNGVGWIQVVTAAPAIRGVLAKELNGVTSYSNALAAGQVSGASLSPTASGLVALPILHNPPTDTVMPLATQLFLMNASYGTNTLNMSFYRPDGSQGAPPQVDTLTTLGDARLYKSILSAAPPGTYSMVIGAQAPLSLQTEIVPYASNGGVAGQATQSADSFIVPAQATLLVLPGVVYNDDVSTLVGIQNMSGSFELTTINIVDSQGTVVHTQQRQIAPGAAATIALSQIGGLPKPFAGSVVATSSLELAGQVEVYSNLSSLIVEKSSTTATVTEAGQVVPYSYLVKNATGETLTGVTLSDNNIDGGTAVCTIGTLAAGQSTTCTAQHTVTQAEMDAGGYLTNVATADSDQTAPVEATLRIPIIQTPVLGLQKSSTTTTVTVAGQVVPYKYVVKNDGNITLTGVTLSDNNIDGGTAVCAIGTLAAGQSTTCTAQHTVTHAEMDAGGDLTNVATADSDQMAPVDDVLNIPILTPTAPLTSVKISGPTVVAGVGVAVDLMAVVSPTSSARPIMYIWQADEQATRVNVSTSLLNQESFAWATPGLKEVKVTAGNTGGSAAAVHDVRVPADSEVVRSGTPVVLEETGPGNWSIQLAVPAGSASPGYALTMTPLSIAQLEKMLQGPMEDTLAGVPVLLEAYLSGDLAPGFVFAVPATLLLRYNDADVARFDEDELRILTVQEGKWVDAAETCTPASQYVRRLAQNELEVQICHLSPYSLAAPWKWLYLPALDRQS